MTKILKSHKPTDPLNPLIMKIMVQTMPTQKAVHYRQPSANEILTLKTQTIYFKIYHQDSAQQHPRPTNLKPNPETSGLKSKITPQHQPSPSPHQS